MEYKRIGDLMVSRIGFGGLTIGGFHYGKTKDRESILAVKKALKLGINFFETADIYGFGKSERIISKGLGRHKAIIATKVGVRWDKKKNKRYYDLSSEHIIKAAKKSLSNLKIKSIPFYQIHYPDPKMPAEITMEALNILEDEGKIKYIGCSNFTPKQISEYQKYGRIEFIQVPYNIIDQGAEKIAKKWKMAVIAHSPIAQGLLSGKYDEHSKFSKNDRRNKSKYFTPRVLKRIKPLLKRIREIAIKYAKTETQVSLRWILDNPNITSVTIGARTEGEIEEAVGAIGWRLSKRERDELTKIGKTILC